MEKQPKSLRSQYRRILELGLILSLLVHIGIIQAYKRLDRTDVAQSYTPPDLVVEMVDRTQVKETAPAPQLPAVPMPSEDPSLPEWETIDPTEGGHGLDPLKIPDPPGGDVGEEPSWTPIFDEPPKPIGGWAAVHRHVFYPEIARKAGVEGQVLVLAYIDRFGNVYRTEILQGLTGCEQAAVEAIHATSWKPAEQHGEPVPVKVAIPIIFKLK